MKIQVVNQTVSDINLGGEVITPSNSITLHKSFIQDERLEELKEDFDIDTSARGLIVIKDYKTTDEDSDDTKSTNLDDENPTETETADENSDDETTKFYAYPKDLIKADGNLTGNVAKKKTIKTLNELGSTFLDDNEFKTQYPELDIEKYRYKGQ